jgi:hypothetical protein
MTVFERNIEVLRRRQPKLAERVSVCTVGPSLSVAPSKAGPPTLAVRVPGRGSVLLHSGYDPVKEAQRLAARYEDAQTENVVMLGLGLGYHVLAYLEREHGRDFMLVVEPHLERLRCCLEQTDLARHIEAHNIVFAVGLAPLEVFRMIRGEECSLVRNGLKAFKHPPSISLDRAYYDEVLRRLQDVMYYALVNSSSRDKSWRHYAANMVRNAPAAMELPGIKELFGVFDGVPAIVVSAGPSLGKNVRELTHAKGRAVIIAVDTALRVLLEHGIRPDLVVSIDFGSNNVRCFERLDTSALRLVVDSEVYPSILEAFEGPCFYAEIANKSASRWLSRALGPRGGLDKGLSVAHTAFLLALEMGCRPVALVGQDLAYTGATSHAKGAAVARVESRGPGVGNLIEVADIFGRPVNSHASMVVFLRHFEELLHTRADRLPDGCIDATEGGARIAGTRLMTLKDTIVRTCTRRVDVDGILDAAASRAARTDPAHALDQVEAMRRELKALARDAASCRTTLKNILGEMGKRRRDPGRIARFQARYSREAASLESHAAGLELLADALTRAMTIMRDRRLASPSLVGRLDAQGQRDAVEQFITVMDDVGEAAEFWLRLLREVKAGMTAQATARAHDGGHREPVGAGASGGHRDTAP